jgi:branched-chain amino acid transport system substrate-binding protein
MPTSFNRNITRRGFITAASVAGLSACSGGLKSSNPSSTGSAGGSGGTIKMGFVSPETGSLAVFTQSNKYVINKINAALSKGITVGGKKYSVEIITKDSQSSSSGAASAASQLIQQDNVHFLLATATPETVIPVSEQAESSGVPCLNTICPWEQWLYTSSGATNPRKYSFMYFLGTQQEAKLYGSVWKNAQTNRVLGGLWPNDADGAGFQKYITAEADTLGIKVVPSGAYTDGTQNYASIIAKFKANNVEILHAVPIPPDLITFWKQAHQDGFKPKVASISKALLFPSVADALGPLVENVMSPVWWTPDFPFRSSLDGTTASQFAADYKTSTGNQWTQPMGFDYSIFEIAVAALKASGDPADANAVVSALSKLKGETITGSYDFSAGPVPNVYQTPDLLAQWRPASGGGYELVVIDNSLLPSVAVQGSLELL